MSRASACVDILDDDEAWQASEEEEDDEDDGERDEEEDNDSGASSSEDEAYEADEEGVAGTVIEHPFAAGEAPQAALLDLNSEEASMESPRMPPPSSLPAAIVLTRRRCGLGRDQPGQHPACHRQQALPPPPAVRTARRIKEYGRAAL